MFGWLHQAMGQALAMQEGPLSQVLLMQIFSSYMEMQALAMQGVIAPL